MGGYLSGHLSSCLRSARASLRPSAWARRLPPPRPARRPRAREPPQRRAQARPLPPAARRRVPGAPPPGPAPLGRDVPAAPAPKAAVTLRIRGPRTCRLQSPVTVRIAPPERSGSLTGCPRGPERPDPCAPDAVLRALSPGGKGRARCGGALWFEVPEAKRRRRSPPRGRSAFAPVGRRGAARPLVPRPGPLLPVQPCGPEAPAARPEPPLGALHPDARPPPARTTQYRPPFPEDLKPEAATVSA